MSLAATGTEQSTALNMLVELRTEAAGYVGDGETLNPGALGKVLQVLGAYGGDPASFIAGRDLEAELRATMLTAGDDAGLFGDGTSVFSQALAILGLSRTTAAVPAQAVDWLLAAQCPVGDFTFDASCPGGIDADTTGLAALALASAGADGPVTTAAANFLLSLQDPDGAIVGFEIRNANSTAIGGQAFAALGYDAAAADADAFLATLQFPATAPPADAGGLRFLEADTVASTFATIQGVWGLGVEPLFEVTAPSFDFIDVGDTLIFADDIQWIAAAGITNGCAVGSYCPADPITRGQIAALLNRSLGLPGGPDAGFSDTVGSVFVDDINALAAAGITNGCDAGLFCPDAYVTRGQMAGFLARAFALSDAGDAGDAGFTDTVGSVFADDIDALAAAGITNGCGKDTYCPSDLVTRGQMAAFLRRSLSA